MMMRPMLADRALDHSDVFLFAEVPCPLMRMNRIDRTASGSIGSICVGTECSAGEEALGSEHSSFAEIKSVRLSRALSSLARQFA